MTYPDSTGVVAQQAVLTAAPTEAVTAAAAQQGEKCENIYPILYFIFYYLMFLFIYLFVFISFMREYCIKIT